MAAANWTRAANSATMKANTTITAAARKIARRRQYSGDPRRGCDQDGSTRPLLNLALLLTLSLMLFLLLQLLGLRATPTTLLRRMANGIHSMGERARYPGDPRNGCDRDEYVVVLSKQLKVLQLPTLLELWMLLMTVPERVK